MFELQIHNLIFSWMLSTFSHTTKSFLETKQLRLSKKLIVMASHSLASTTLAAPNAATPFSTCSSRRRSNRASSLSFPRVWACSSQCSARDDAMINRRSFAVGLASAVLGLSVSANGESANAAARRPPPQPPAEKKDPNITGLAAKILASKKRKAAMKEAVEKQKQKGKPVKQE